MRAALLLVAMVSASSMAQTSWRAAPDGPQVSVDAFKPFLDSGEMFWTSAWSIGAQTPLRPWLQVRADLPFALGGAETPAFDLEFAPEDPNQSAAVLGNLGLSVDADLNSHLSLGAGVRLPTATRPDNPDTRPEGDPAEAIAFGAGVLSSPEAYEAFLVRTLGVHVSVTGRFPVSEMAQVRVGLSPVVQWYTGEIPDNPFGPELARTNAGLTGHVMADANLRGATWAGGLMGRYDPLEGTYAWADDVQIQGLLGVRRARGRVRPGVHARLPLVGDFVPDAVIGLNLDVALR